MLIIFGNFDNLLTIFWQYFIILAMFQYEKKLVEGFLQVNLLQRELQTLNSIMTILDNKCPRFEALLRNSYLSQVMLRWSCDACILQEYFGSICLLLIKLKRIFRGALKRLDFWIGPNKWYTKHRKNWECCPVSLLIVRSSRLSWIQILNFQNCNQCLKCHMSFYS